MNKTKIEWTDYTWNPVTNCYDNFSIKVDEGYIVGLIDFGTALELVGEIGSST